MRLHFSFPTSLHYISVLILLLAILHWKPLSGLTWQRKGALIRWNLIRDLACECATGGESKNPPVRRGFSVRQPTVQRTGNAINTLLLTHRCTHLFKLGFLPVCLQVSYIVVKSLGSQFKNLYSFIIKMPNCHWLRTRWQYVFLWQINQWVALCRGC